MELAYLAWIILLGALWGSSFTLIKISVAGMPPFTLGAIRVVLAAIVLWGYLRAKGERIPWSKQLTKHLVFVGIINLGIPFAAIGWGTQYLPSGVVGILNAVMPLMCFILAAISGTEKATWAHLVGVVVGFGGILVLMLPKMGGGRTHRLAGGRSDSFGFYLLCYRYTVHSQTFDWIFSACGRYRANHFFVACIGSPSSTRKALGNRYHGIGDMDCHHPRRRSYCSGESPLLWCHSPLRGHA